MPTPAEIAADLRPKLAKRLLLCAHEAVPWSHAMKSHRQLHDAGLVFKGTDGQQDVALASPEGEEVAAELRKAANPKPKPGG